MVIGFCLWITAQTLFLIFRFPVCCQRGTFVFCVRVFWGMSENRVYGHRFLPMMTYSTQIRSLSLLVRYILSCYPLYGGKKVRVLFLLFVLRVFDNIPGGLIPRGLYPMRSVLHHGRGCRSVCPGGISRFLRLWFSGDPAGCCAGF